MTISEFTGLLANAAWGPHMLVLLMGGGLFFLFYSGFTPLRYLKHAIDLVRGKFNDKNATGEISHAGALASAMAGTVGMGNIGSVAVAIVVGGPGAIFWMWMSAIVGMATKFFTGTLSVMYRSVNRDGSVSAGPMYIIEKGLGKHWKPLAILFASVGMIGNLPLFNTNQLVQVIKTYGFVETGLFNATEPTFILQLAIGITLAIVVGFVLFGGIKRIANIAIRLVPAMVLIYLACALIVLVTHFDEVPYYLALIVTEAFNGEAVAGGVLGSILIGMRRAAFSNEAGIGTEVMAHGQAKTSEPVREGLVAMLGPAIDTLLVCTATALIILLSGVWQHSEAEGVVLSTLAFKETLGLYGPFILAICIFFFGISTIFTQAFYGSTCFSYLFGKEKSHYYLVCYLSAIVIAAVSELSSIVNIIDTAYAIMAIPTMTAALMLAPKVKMASQAYFEKMRIK